jgi:hypothetical protein
MGFLFTVNLPSITNLPKDAVTNSFVVANTLAFGDTERESAMDAIVDFYNLATPTSTVPVANRLSQALSRATDACTIRCYDITTHLDGSNHGSPVDARSFTLAASAGATGLPSEVACVLRFEALGRDTALVEAPDSGDSGLANDRPKQRHTGRVFLGPLVTQSIAAGSNPPRLATDNINTFLEAGQRLAQDIDTIDAGVGLGVWSRADAVIRVVGHVAVDNAFDTQRRRGEAATGITRLAV